MNLALKGYKKMKITKSQLRRIIKEELESVLSENQQMQQMLNRAYDRDGWRLVVSKITSLSPNSDPEAIKAAVQSDLPYEMEDYQKISTAVSELTDAGLKDISANMYKIKQLHERGIKLMKALPGVDPRRLDRAIDQILGVSAEIKDVWSRTEPALEKAASQAMRQGRQDTQARVAAR
jgi:hypothetical protein